MVIVAAPLGALPITYTALFNNVPAVGAICQPNGQPMNPFGAVYYSFSALAGSTVTIRGARLPGPYDMSFVVLPGLYSDTDDFGGSFGSFGYLAFGDDELPPNIPGRFGDPRVTIVAPSSGWYTVAVTNFLSNGTPPYQFQLVATGITAIPEAGTSALAGLGLLLMGALALRRR